VGSAHFAQVARSFSVTKAVEQWSLSETASPISRSGREWPSIPELHVGCVRPACAVAPTYAAQCHLIPDAMTLEEAALVEPTAVALHAVRRSEVRAGMRAAVLGGGPIGLLVIQVLKSLGAASVDLVEPDQGRRERALDLGADSVHAPADLSLAGRMRERELDLVIEASGVPESLAFALDITDPGGVIVQVGSLPASEISLRATSVLARELDLRGSFRFLNEFPDALDLIASGSVRAATLVDATFDFKDAAAALEFAAQGTAIKTQIAVSRGSQGSADWAAAARDQTAGVSN
jgi:threonine dehydrogenase-like Zn-dependent dehydrogenase